MNIGRQDAPLLTANLTSGAFPSPEAVFHDYERRILPYARVVQLATS